MTKALFYLIFFLALFGNTFFLYGFLPEPLAVTTEISIILLFAIAILSKIGRGQVPRWHLFPGFLMICFVAACSMFFNQTEPVRAVFSLRLLYRFYFLYLALINLDLDEKTLKKFNFYLLILLVGQLPVVAYKFYHQGIAETTMGAYGRGGSLTAMLPVVVIFYLAAYYFLERPRKLYLLIGLGFILFSIVGKKRAVLFFYPIEFLAIYYFIYCKGKQVDPFQKAGVLILSIIAMTVVSASILYFNPTLNPEQKVGGSIDPAYALSYAIDYTTRENELGYTTGRFSTTKRILSVLSNGGITHLFFGVGPGAYTTSLFDTQRDRKRVYQLEKRLGIGYGVTSMSRIALEYGVLGVVAFALIPIAFCFICRRQYRLETDPYWLAFAAGSMGFAFAMLAFFIVYHHPSFWGDTLPALYFYAMAVVYTRSRDTGCQLSATSAEGTVR